MLESLAGYLAAHKVAVSIWLGAVFTFGIYSVLYKENPYYRLAEHVFIGLATGLGVYLTWSNALKPKWWDMMVGKGQWWWALALLGGAMFYFIYSKRHGWISRLIMGSMMGLGAGAEFQNFANLYFPMIRGSFKPVVPTAVRVAEGSPGLGLSLAASNLVFVIILITVMAYFFFSVDHRSKSMRNTASLGRWFLMFAFGAMFGSTVMARMALFIGRLDFITTEWVPIVPPWFWIALTALVVLLIGYVIFRPRPPKNAQAETSDELKST